MDAHPIIFSSSMVRALLAGQKTQTRRILLSASICPHGETGGRLWVRENWKADKDKNSEGHYGYTYLADGARSEFDYSHVGTGRVKLGKTYPSIFMPRWASRITLEITGTRAERVQDISEADAITEGVSNQGGTARESYQLLWDSLHAKKPGHAWESNPWVWVISFRMLESEAAHAKA